MEAREAEIKALEADFVKSLPTMAYGEGFGRRRRNRKKKAVVPVDGAAAPDAGTATATSTSTAAPTSTAAAAPTAEFVVPAVFDDSKALAVAGLRARAGSFSAINDKEYAFGAAFDQALEADDTDAGVTTDDAGYSSGSSDSDGNRSSQEEDDVHDEMLLGPYELTDEIEICDRAWGLSMGHEMSPQKSQWRFEGGKADAHELMPPPPLSITVPAIASLSTSISASNVSVLSDDITETPRTTSWWMDTTFSFLAGDDDQVEDQIAGVVAVM